MMFIFGVTFEFPVVLVALEMANVVTLPNSCTTGVTRSSPSPSPRRSHAEWRPTFHAGLALPLAVFYFIAIGVG